MFYRLGQSTVNIYENDSAFQFRLQIYEKATPIDTSLRPKQSDEKLQLSRTSPIRCLQINDDQSISEL
jgi:hypothetical protein